MSEGRKSKIEGRKRFTDKQISFLEYMFETESRPELRMKHQLANKLGLHPRQVAIWFQNKRARSKSRQIEQEYNTLKLNYESLASKSESLKKENQALLNQLEMLRNVEERNGENTTGNSSSGSEESEDRTTNEQAENMKKKKLGFHFCTLEKKVNLQTLKNGKRVVAAWGWIFRGGWKWNSKEMI